MILINHSLNKCFNRTLLLTLPGLTLFRNRSELSLPRKHCTGCLMTSDYKGVVVKIHKY